MVQTVRTATISAGQKTIIFEKPRVLTRIFFSIWTTTDKTVWHKAKISFDDPSFSSCYMLDGDINKFESEGQDIFQGNIWLYNLTDTIQFYSLTEILH